VTHHNVKGKNDAFTITRILGGCIYNCYRCGVSGIITRGSNPNEALRRIGKMRVDRYSHRIDSKSNYSITFPNDAIPLVTYDKVIPPHAYAWFYQYELDHEDFDEHYIVYSPKLERVIVPMWDSNKLIAWQGRDVYYNRNIDLFNRGILKTKPLKYYTEYISNGKKLFF
jgi:hypothetical protein